MKTKETPQQMADRLKFECDMGDMNGIVYDDENREPDQLWTGAKVIRPKTSESGLNIDSWDRPDVLPPVEPFYIERYEDKKVLKYKE